MCMRIIFFFNDTATTEIYTLSLHDALPISAAHQRRPGDRWPRALRADHEGRLRRGEEGAGRRPDDEGRLRDHRTGPRDRKSTRLNSSHANISYAVFCLKKKQ